MTTFLIVASTFALILSIGNSVLILSLEQEAKKRDKFKRNVDTLYEKYTVWHPKSKEKSSSKGSKKESTRWHRRF